ncbi:MAG: hypothetical protein IKL92_03515 [Oscillospiraceae bacterium]|nr:hypothetical protein [Oscillospiraceae bacterium]
MEQKTIRYVVIKYALYFAAMILLFALGERTALLPFGIRSVPVIGLFIAIGMIENELAGGLFGLMAGILCDGASALVFGTASILFLLMGCGVGLLSMYLINPRPKSAMLLTTGAALSYGLVTHYFLYGIWGYEGSGLLLVTHTFPSVVLTGAWGFALFYVVKSVHTFIEMKIEG